MLRRMKLMPLRKKKANQSIGTFIPILGRKNFDTKPIRINRVPAGIVT
jgi:hypothetical protein